MEFICVFSVAGSLTSYFVKQETKTTYSAVLRSSQGNQNDLPVKLLLEKKASAWMAKPQHEEITKNISQAIDGNAAPSKDLPV